MASSLQGKRHRQEVESPWRSNGSFYGHFKISGGFLGQHGYNASVIGIQQQMSGGVANAFRKSRSGTGTTHGSSKRSAHVDKFAGPTITGTDTFSI